jgi:hypothetical protein
VQLIDLHLCSAQLIALQLIALQLIASQPIALQLNYLQRISPYASRAFHDQSFQDVS